MGSESEIRMERMYPELYKAATHGKVDVLKRLLRDKPPKILSSTTPQRNTALHLAAMHGHTEFARRVLESNEELLVAQNEDGDSPLHLAAKEDRQKVARLLVDLARARQKDPNGGDAGTQQQQLAKTPLTMANRVGNTPLHEAMRQGRSDMALLILHADPYRGHDLNGHKETPLHMAAREGLESVVRKIVEFQWVEEEYKADESVRGTALHQAVLGRHKGIVKILLEKRPELIDLTDSDGNNALHYAAQKDQQFAVEMLLKERPGLAYARNSKSQSSPLHVAAHHGSTAAIRALLRQCPDAAEMTDAAGQNAFHAAVASGKTDALRCLIRLVRPAELLNRVDGSGNTPLHLAADMCHVQSALLLLKDSRVNPCVPNRDGHTARSLLEARSAQGSRTHSEVHIRTADGGGGGGHQPHTRLEIRSADGEVDAYEMYLWKKLKRQESIRCRKQPLPPVTGAFNRRTSHKYFERSVETYILVATLIATVTFAATFTMPGGYDQTKGIALQGNKTAFKIFVISNTVAMCSSIIVVFCFIWAWKNPIKFMVDQLLWGHRLTIVACLGMLVSLMTTVYITVAPTSRWPAYVVIAIGISTPGAVVLILGRDVIFVPL